MITHPLLPVPSKISSAQNTFNSNWCTLVTDNPDRECKIEKIINQEINTWHIYALAWHNCYHWVNYVLMESLK